MTSTLPPLVQAMSGAVGSASASALTYPLDLITTRLQLDSPTRAKKRGGIVGGLRLLLYIVYGDKMRGRKGMGWKALYDGLGADMFATVLSNFFYFYFYSFLRSVSMYGLQSLPLLRNARNTPPKKVLHKPTLLEDIALGFIAGIASRAVSSPLNIITLRLQAERAEVEDEDVTLADDSSDASSSGRKSPAGGKEDMGPADIARMIYKEQGWKGFWRGFGTSALLCMNPSITLAFFQLFRNAVLRSRARTAALSGKSTPTNLNLKPWEAFFVGATATSIANTILYPLILAKKRLQAGSGKPGDTLLTVLLDAYSGKYNPHPEEGGIEHGASSTKKDGAQKKPSVPRRSKSRYNANQVEGKGAEGVYQGLQMQLLKGFFNQGVTFLVKGRIEQLVVAAYLRQRGITPASTN